MTHHTDVRFLEKEARTVEGVVAMLEEMGITCPELIADTIEGETRLHDIIADLIKGDGELDAQIEALAEYKKKIDERLKRTRAAKETVRERLREALRLSQKDRIVTAFGTLHYSRGQADAVVAQEVDLPTKYFKRNVDETLVKQHARAFYKQLETLIAAKDDDEFEALLIELKVTDDMIPWFRMYREINETEDPEERDELLGIFMVENPPIPGVIISPPVQSISIRRN